MCYPLLIFVVILSKIREKRNFCEHFLLKLSCSLHWYLEQFWSLCSCFYPHHRPITSFFVFQISARIPNKQKTLFRLSLDAVAVRRISSPAFFFIHRRCWCRLKMIATAIVLGQPSPSPTLPAISSNFICSAFGHYCRRSRHVVAHCSPCLPTSLRRPP